MFEKRGVVLSFRGWKTPEMPETAEPLNVAELLREAGELVAKANGRDRSMDDITSLLVCLRPLFADQPSVLRHMHTDDAADDFDGFRERWLEFGRVSGVKLGLSGDVSDKRLIQHDAMAVHLAIIINELISREPQLAESTFNRMRDLLLEVHGADKMAV